MPRLLVFSLLLLTVQIALSLRLFKDAEPSDTHVVLFSAVPGKDIPRDTWKGNYATESEAARIYHWLREHGVPDDNIILFMSGDFTNSERNPGTVYTDVNRTRNYVDGLKIDYNGTDVSAENYLAVLRGKANEVKGGNGRVLKRLINGKNIKTKFVI